jgi:DNA-binding winged helix-turn-helix (wHTH) protein
VYLIRKRLSQTDDAGRELIETVPGFGYRLAVDREMTDS